MSSETRLNNTIKRALNEKRDELDLSQFDTGGNLEWDPYTDGMRVSDTFIFSIPNYVFELTSLKRLNISNNDIEVVPVEIGYLTELEEINLSGNQLRELPKEFKNLKKLKKLLITKNKFRDLPSVIGELESLEILDMSNNLLSNLPSQIEHLKNLLYLNVSNNRIADISIEIAGMSKLKALYLSNNKLVDLPPAILNLKSLTALYLSGNLLETLPNDLNALEQLEILDISYNKLNALPSELSNLRCLKSLMLSFNQLQHFPIQIGNLNNLIFLDISYNLIKSLPDDLFRLDKLKFLNACGNRIAEIPSSIGKLKSIKYLLLGDTSWAVRNIEDIENKSLELSPSDRQRIQHNQIETIPKEIGELKKLEHLDLGGNRIRILPPEIKQLQSLGWIDLKENRLLIPPEIIRFNDPVIIFNYYFEKVNTESRPLHESKLLVVGQGSVGKTSLVKRLLGNQFNPNENKTEGIHINNWSVIVNRETFSQNIWDFGGQEIMHATHQFFLTKRSLYLLVLDSRLTQEENRVEYWLKIIQSFGGDSPVIIVGNKTDQHPLDIDRRGLMNKYSNIKEIVEVSCVTGEGVRNLQATIAREVAHLSHIHDRLPLRWFNVKKRLEKMEQDYIPYADYISLCQEEKIIDELSQQTLIGFLHDLGIVINFRDDPRLEDTNILNPQWVTNGVYKMLNAHALFQNQGKLTIDMLNDILNIPEYPRNKHLFIVDMMRKFELCYDIEPSQIFLVPDLLPKDEPFTGEWDGSLAFQYYYNVLPSSIISRFIVRMNTFVHKTVWRSGVVLKSGGNTALVKADTEDRKIFIWVNGDEPTRRDFLSVIRAEFAAIHKTIVKIEAREKVPVPGYSSVVVDYEHLLKLERKGVAEFIPEGLDDPVSVRQLLDGVAAPDARQDTSMDFRRIERESARASSNPNPATQQKAEVAAVDVFLSYAIADKDEARMVFDILMKEEKTAFLAERSIEAGDFWEDRIKEALKNCRYFWILVTPNSLHSEWVITEWATAWSLDKKIVPILFRCKPEDLPKRLQSYQCVDFHQIEKAVRSIQKVN